jgi:hypothetical protein
MPAQQFTEVLQLSMTLLVMLPNNNILKKIPSLIMVPRLILTGRCYLKTTMRNLLIL